MPTETYLAWVCAAAIGLNLAQLWFYRRVSRKLRAAEEQCRQLQAQLQADPPTQNYPKFSHPAWGLIRIAALIAGLAAILWTTASDFDSTEISTILGYLVVLIGAQQVAP